MCHVLVPSELSWGDRGMVMVVSIFDNVLHNEKLGCWLCPAQPGLLPSPKPGRISIPSMLGHQLAESRNGRSDWGWYGSPLCMDLRSGAAGDRRVLVGLLMICRLWA